MQTPDELSQSSTTPADGQHQPAEAENAGPLFAELGLHPDLLKGIHDMGFIRPTPIQAKAIPPIIAGRDVIGSAQTGTGKTAAFVLPILHRLMQRRGTTSPRALIIAPTRELALQSMEHLRLLSRYVHLKGAAIFGGVPMDPQISALRRGVDIVSATPGRLLDHIYQGTIDFAAIETFVLDELDRMLDMGFLPDIQRIISMLPPERQTLMFSATIPDEILHLAKDLMRDPVTVRVTPRMTVAAGIRHALYPVSRAQKTSLLLQLLRQQKMESVLIFTRTKQYADRLSIKLTREGFKVSVLHGDRSQSQRLRALEQFRRGHNSIMVATDIAARGLDIEDISHVVNFDIPNTPEDYVHRIGRTARAEATGDAFTLVSPDEEEQVQAIETTIKQKLPRVTLPDFDYTHEAPGGKPHDRQGHGRGFRGRGQGHGQGQRPHVGAHGQPGHGQGAGQGRHRRGRRGGSGGHGHASGPSHA